MNKVTVVVPIYNAGEKLHKCIRSILNQTFKDFELILVNDGSTDNSLSICEKFKQEDQRIIIINKSNEGSIVTRNKGIEASKTDYVMFVDADDWISKNMIEILYNESIANDADVTVCNLYKVLGRGRLIKRENENKYFLNDRIYTNEQIKDEIVIAYLHGHPFPAALYAKLYKKELLLNSGTFLESIRFLGDDLFYNLEIFLKAKRVKVINKPLYYYRLGGFSSKYMPYLFDDMVNGYNIQKGVVEEYFQETFQNRFNGISIMLLNTFKTCLKNLFNGRLGEEEIKSELKRFVKNEKVRECLDNEGCKAYFNGVYLEAIRVEDIHYLYKLGKKSYKMSIPRKYIIKVLSLVC